MELTAGRQGDELALETLHAQEPMHSMLTALETTVEFMVVSNYILDIFLEISTGIFLKVT